MKLNSNCNSNPKSNSNDGDHVTDLFYPSKRIQSHTYNIQHTTYKVKGALNVDYVCDVNCYGDADGAETTCDAVNIACAQMVFQDFGNVQVLGFDHWYLQVKIRKVKHLALQYPFRKHSKLFHQKAQKSQDSNLLK